MRYKKKQIQKKIKVALKKYIRLLKLEQWHIDTVISKDDLISSRFGKVTKNKADFYAEVIYNYLTQSALITLTKLQTIDETEELDDTLLHELLHIKLSPLMQLVESLITLAGVNKDKSAQLIEQIDEQEHDIIKTIINLTIPKKRGK